MLPLPIIPSLPGILPRFFLDCLTLVSFLEIHASQTYMISVNILAMGPTVLVRRCSEHFARSWSLLQPRSLKILKQRSDFLEIIFLFFQMLENFELSLVSVSITLLSTAVAEARF